MFNPYTKAILGAVLAFLAAISTAWDDSVLTTTEIVTAIGVGIAALGAIWAVRPELKWIVSGVLAGIAALAVALQDDSISAQEWITIVVATLTALGAIYATSNTEASNEPSPKPSP
jgi:peptidoglycan/LPS O-acetylase OafA/YrhL